MHLTLPMAKLSPELTLLIVLMQSSADAPENLDDERFAALMHKNRLEPLLRERLPARLLPLLPPEDQALTMRQITALAGVTRLFSAKGVTALAVKGPALAMELYGTPALRSFHDVDLLIPASQVDQAVALLLEDGWRWHEQPILTTPRRRQESRHYQNHYLFIKGEVYLELHWRLLPWTPQDFPLLWQAHRSLTLGGVPLQTPGTLHQLAHLIVHGTRHGFHRLKWLADLAELLPRHKAEMDALHALMAASGQEAALLMTWALLLMLPLDMPDAAFGGFTLCRDGDGVVISAPDAAAPLLHRVQRMLDALLPLLEADHDTENTPAAAAYRRLLPQPKHLQSPLARLVIKLRPRPWLWARIDLPDSLYWLYWPLRPLEKLWRTLHGTKRHKNP